ncbi:hypothetical protein DRQ53_12325, partial [bacterium]
MRLSVETKWLAIAAVFALVITAMPGDAEAQFKKGRRFSSGGACTSCHEMEQADAKVRHEPFRKGDCESCHKPHGMVGVLRLKEIGALLCATCHDRSE